MSKKPVVLMVLDGYGLSSNPEGNAIAMAQTPVMDKLMKECPFVEGQASGMAVGLPDGQMGNSEVGHMNIGAGRIIYQDLTRITKAIDDGDFFQNEVLLRAMENCKKNNSDLHLWGLLSDGGVHSHITHLYGLLEMAKKNGLSNVYVHAFLDGRDTPPASGKSFVEALQQKMDEIVCAGTRTFSTPPTLTAIASFCKNRYVSGVRIYSVFWSCFIATPPEAPSPTAHGNSCLPYASVLAGSNPASNTFCTLHRRKPGAASLPQPTPAGLAPFAAFFPAAPVKAVSHRGDGRR